MEKTRFMPVNETVSQLTKAFRFLPNRKAVRKPMKGVKSMSQIRGICEFRVLSFECGVKFSNSLFLKDFLSFSRKILLKVQFLYKYNTECSTDSLVRRE